MCGIAGTYRDDTDVTAMLARIRHRGPDGEGVVADGDVVHGHVRLAILDPTPRSDQPFRYRDGVLSYNGELWNYVELRDELVSLGHVFRTSGDTEVVAAALDEWGPDALPRLDGMFAFSWSDPRRRFLARSRFGTLSLYLLRSFGGFAWASERKAFGSLAGAAEAILPGTWFDLETGCATRWYDVPFRPEFDAADVEGLIVRGVTRRMIADVPVCALLSGGVDSALTTALVARIRPDVVAYTAYVWETSSDLAAARTTAAYLGVELREVRVDPPSDADVEAAVYQIEVPNRTSIETATLAMALSRRISADGFKVAISGEAADELFGGYGTLARRATSDEAWRTARLAFLAKMGRADFHRVMKSAYSAGVEVRLPFLERGLVEGVTSLGVRACPPGKGLLRRIAARYLPPEIAMRPKVPFHVAAGVRAYLDDRHGGHPDIYYNDILRRTFGRITRG